MEVVTKGGFHMIIAPKGSSFETVGAGPHRCVARHIAAGRDKSIVWTELSKGDWVDPSHYEYLLPKYEAMTDELRRLHGDEE